MKEILTERQNLFEPNVYITMCVELTGKVCLYLLTAAIKEAYKANEALCQELYWNMALLIMRNYLFPAAKQ